MAFNIRYLIAKLGFLKLLSVVIGCGLIVIGGYAHFDSEFTKRYKDNFNSTGGALKQNSTDYYYGTNRVTILWMEKIFLLAVTGTCFLSALFFILHIITDKVQKNPIWNGIDLALHLTGCIALLIAAVFLLFTTWEIKKEVCDYIDKINSSEEKCQHYIPKLASAGLAAINGLVFGIISAIVGSNGPAFQKLETV